MASGLEQGEFNFPGAQFSARRQKVHAADTENVDFRHKYPQIRGHPRHFCLSITPKIQAWIFQTLVEGWQIQQRGNKRLPGCGKGGAGKGQQLYLKMGGKGKKKGERNQYEIITAIIAI